MVMDCPEARARGGPPQEAMPMEVDQMKATTKASGESKCVCFLLS